MVINLAVKCKLWSIIVVLKPLPFKIPRSHGEAIVVQHDREPALYNILHKHPELQLIRIKKSTGTAIVGGYVGEFKPGDVFIIGSNVPHVFRNDEVYFSEVNEQIAEVVYVFLDETIPDHPMTDLPEVKSLFLKARKGIRLEGDLCTRVGGWLDAAPAMKRIQLLATMLKVAEALDVSQAYRYLNPEGLDVRLEENEGKRLNEVIQFTFEHYRRKITLEEVADIANMAPSAFCRFFKRRTRKTYVEFLNGIRIQMACKLLMNKDYSATEVCYRSGFNNFSYYNRKFKQVTGFTPYQYQREVTAKAAD